MSFLSFLLFQFLLVIYGGEGRMVVEEVVVVVVRRGRTRDGEEEKVGLTR